MKSNDQALDAAKWVASPAGQKAIRKAMKQAQIEVDQLKKAREIDLDELNKPMTI